MVCNWWCRFDSKGDMMRIGSDASVSSGQEKKAVAPVRRPDLFATRPDEMKKRTQLSLLAAGTILSTAFLLQSAAMTKASTREIPLAVLRDKIEGGERANSEDGDDGRACDGRLKRCRTRVPGLRRCKEGPPGSGGSRHRRAMRNSGGRGRRGAPPVRRTASIFRTPGLDARMSTLRFPIH